MDSECDIVFFAIVPPILSSDSKRQLPPSMSYKIKDSIIWHLASVDPHRLGIAMPLFYLVLALGVISPERLALGKIPDRFDAAFDLPLCLTATARSGRDLPSLSAVLVVIG